MRFTRKKKKKNGSRVCICTSTLTVVLKYYDIHEHFTFPLLLPLPELFSRVRLCLKTVAYSERHKKKKRTEEKKTHCKTHCAAHDAILLYFIVHFSPEHFFPPPIPPLFDLIVGRQKKKKKNHHTAKRFSEGILRIILVYPLPLNIKTRV